MMWVPGAVGNGRHSDLGLERPGSEVRRTKGSVAAQVGIGFLGQPHPPCLSGESGSPCNITSNLPWHVVWCSFGIGWRLLRLRRTGYGWLGSWLLRRASPMWSPSTPRVGQDKRKPQRVISPGLPPLRTIAARPHGQCQRKPWHPHRDPGWLVHAMCRKRRWLPQIAPDGVCARTS